MVNINDISNELKNKERNILGHEKALKSAVFIPLLKVDDEWHILFEVRSHQLKRQPGEICFPGGRVDEDDKTDLDAAIRETCEELQISKANIQLLGSLDIFASSQFFLVYPHVGIIKEHTAIAPNPGEVEEVFTFPLSWLMNHEPELHHLEMEIKSDQDFPFDLIPNGKEYNWRTNHIPEYFYLYKDRVIWGLTARILRHFLGLLH
jgi:coenzyme A diphosphatase NUDT7